MIRRVRVLVSGDVQGVGFRWFCREQAMGLGLGGSVRNLPDGRVEAFFEGPAQDVQDMIDWCRHGPGMATVARAEVEEFEPEGQHGFAMER